jgi:hypothetical protein
MMTTPDHKADKPACTGSRGGGAWVGFHDLPQATLEAMKASLARERADAMNGAHDDGIDHQSSIN